MAKKNKNTTPPSVALSELDKQLQELELQRQNLINAQQKATEEARAALMEKVNGLPAHLGVTTLDEVLTLIRKSKNGGVGAGRARISDAQKENITSLLREEKLPLREIAEKTSVSIQTVHNIKKELGLVKARATAAK